MAVIVNGGVPPYRLTVSIAGGGSVSGDFKRQSRPNGPYDTMRFFVPTEKPGTRLVSITVDDAKGNRASRILPFSVTARVTCGVDPLVGSYNGKVRSLREPDKNVYWAHVVSRNSDGTYTIALYYDRNGPCDITLKPNGSPTMHSDSFRGDANGTGSISGNGGRPTPYTWVLTKYSNQDGAAPSPGYVLHSH
jgi:hypothetical protein